MLIVLHLYCETKSSLVQFKLLIHDLSKYIVYSLLCLKCVHVLYMAQNIMEIRNSHKVEVPCFDFENFSRKGFKELQVSEESGVVSIYIHPSLSSSTCYCVSRANSLSMQLFMKSFNYYIGSIGPVW